MGLTDQLRNSNKGRLSYDRSTAGPHLKSLLEACSSPPEIQVSPKFAQYVQRTNEDEKSDEEKTVPAQLDRQKLSGHRSPATSESSETGDIRIVAVKQPVTSPEYGKSSLAIQKYEQMLEAKSRKARCMKQQEFEVNLRQIDRAATASLQQLEERASNHIQHQVINIEHRQQSQADEMVKQHRLLKETHKQRKQVHDARIQEAELTKQRLQQEEARRRQHENQQRLDTIQKTIVDLQKLNTKLQTLYSACQYQQHMSEAAKKSLGFMQQLVGNAENIYISCQETGETTADKYEKICRILEQAKNAYEFVKQGIAKATKDGEAEAAERAKQEAANAPPTPTAPAPAPTTSGAGRATLTTEDVIAAASGESLCVDIEAFKQYMILQRKLKTVEQSVQSISAPQWKKLKFDFQKAVNTPINAISPVSGDHLRDKLRRLLGLLGGQSVEVSGRHVSIKDQPEAPTFCKHLIAKMLVKKGEEQVSSKHDSAFAIAMTAAGLWREHPDLGELLLAQFHSMCPYIVPYYIPKEAGQSDDEYLKARGYKFDDGVVERQDKFLKRMSGIMRLYAAILVSSPPRGAHPHDVEHAWIWLSRVMNIDPEPDITATMIYDILQVTGHALFNTYRKQFLKLLHILIKEMLPKLRAVTSAGGGGALSRLQLLLENSVKDHGTMAVPEGYLPSNFWMS